jgi:diguanylate cyclase (GGDEF)-like protein
MMNGCILYFGKDENFKRALSTSAATLGISFQDFSRLSDFSSQFQDPYLIILDADAGIKYSDLQWNFLPDTTALLIIAAQDPKQAETILQKDDFSANITDVFIKSYQSRMLTKKLDFYLTSSSLSPTPNEPHNAIRLESTIHDIQPRVEQLHQHLQQADFQLGAQKKVLEKIRQVSRLSRRINCLDLDAIASICIEEIPTLIASRFASLYQFDPDKEILHLLRHNHPYPIDRLVVLTEHEESPMAAAINMKKLLVIKDLAALADTHDLTVNRLFARNYRSNSCVIAPLLSGDNILGVLNLADKIDAPCFESTNDLLPMQLLCDIIGSAMSNIRLFDEVQRRARTDSMTQLYNHRAFYDELEKEVRRSRRYGGNLSLIIIDLDNLKQINDQHGHRAGDAVILHTAAQISRCIREFDIAARYGGDEFAIILPNTHLQDAVTVGQRLLQMVSEIPVELDRLLLTASVSVGVCQYHGDSIEEFMNNSDAALFEAKTAGKNCIHIFDPAQK